MNRAALGLIALIVTSGCGGGIATPAMVAMPDDSTLIVNGEIDGVLEADVSGQVVVGSTGCWSWLPEAASPDRDLYVEPLPIVWPHGTSPGEGESALVPGLSKAVQPGDTIEGAGGFEEPDAFEGIDIRERCGDFDQVVQVDRLD